ncbi:aspartate/methionine/tyrosine aminotransferase [Stella humosa]|uniref:Aspartate/methionine/tyrosine aminotransferase n=1 Tax=Stella humosa TaxID=94 RepID=A0A3N1LJ51_9PROT|nr:aminotransferase class I/II-fold pyridoxal phosphate-dependent enzyme [Stella humosa]ROP90899.1 aspartate/methionine/tyrosine aminotransferase [Stella humosa]BBK34751.1 aminotransferase [Stella humosa]
MLNERLEALGDNPFYRLATLLAGTQPLANETPLLMSAGEPQHPPPALLAETVAANAHLWGKYPGNEGSPEFRRAATNWLNRRYGLPEGMIDPERQVLPLVGTKEGLYLLAQVAVPQEKKGKRPTVLLPNPYYHVYNAAAVMSGAEAVFLPATKETGFLPDLDAIPEETLERCALFYLCSPANPQGALADLDYLKRLIALARRYDFVLLADECYAEIYDTVPPPGALEAAAAMGGSTDHVLVMHSLSKRSSAPGIRCGFVAGCPDLLRMFTRLRSYGGSTVPMPLLAAATALWDEETHVAENRALYRQKIDIAERVIGDRFAFYRPPGGFFLWLDVGDGEKATHRLWTQAGIKVVPGGYIARPNADGSNIGQPYIRVALVHDADKVEAGLGRLVRALG